MKLSIVICNHNYGEFIENAIRSALAQDFADREIIVVDDGSTDSSHQVISRWNARVKVVFKPNGGQISAYNAGIAEASGDVLLFLDSDDTLDHDAGTRIAEQFLDPSVAKVHFRLRLVDRFGNRLGGVIPSDLASGDLSSMLRRHGELYPSAPGSGNAYRASVLRQLAPLPDDPVDKVGADFFAIYGASLLGEVRALEGEPLGCYRIHRDANRRALTFGNAARAACEPLRTQRRYARLRRWLTERLGEEYALPAVAPDFSLEKQRYASAIFSADSYAVGFRAGAGLLRSHLLPSILRRRRSRAHQAGLVGWALAVLLLPRRMGMPVARYVCNPADR